MMSRFDDSDGVTPCHICKKITPKGEIIAMVQTEYPKEVQTCIDLPCMMRAASPPKANRCKK